MSIDHDPDEELTPELREMLKHIQPMSPEMIERRKQPMEWKPLRRVPWRERLRLWWLARREGDR